MVAADAQRTVVALTGAVALAVGWLAAANPLLAAGALGALAAAGALALRPAPVTLLAGWLVLAPLLQNDAGAHPAGAAAALLLYKLPPLAFLGWLVYDRRRRPRPPRLLWADWLPSLLLALMCVSLVLRPPDDPPGTGNPFVNSVYWNAGIGVVMYYVIAFGHLGRDAGAKIALAVMAAGALASGVALAERFAGIDVWGAGTVSSLGGYRFDALTGTLSNPTVVGSVAATGAALATALLVWGAGGARLRGAGLAVLAITVPTVLLTLERAPLVALAVAVLIVVATRRRAWNAALVAGLVAALAGLLVWGHFTSSRLYEQRVGNAETVAIRGELAERSIELFLAHPLAGTGYNTFDEVKNAPSGPAALPGGIFDTSHNTFLTLLVELGAAGLLALLIHWGWVLKRARRAWGDGGLAPWLGAGWLAVLSVYAVNALLIDMRFFSLVAVLPWIALGFLRRASHGDAGKGRA